MLILRDKEVTYRAEKSHCSSSQRLDETSNEFRSRADSEKQELFPDMLLQLKAVAIDPCSANESATIFQELLHHILIARKVLSLSNVECPQKKQQLDKLLREEAVASNPLSKKPIVQSVGEKEKSSLASPSSCLISHADSAESSDHILASSVKSLGFGGSLSRKSVCDGAYFQSYTFNRDSLNMEGSTLNDSDDSFSGSNLLSPAEPVPQTSRRVIKLSKTNHTPQKRLLNCPTTGGPLQYSPGDSVNCLSLATKKPKKYQKSCKSVQLLNFEDPLLRLPIPVGPRFQADIPDWTGLPNRDISDSLEKWLGIRVWPVGENAEISRELIGKGRPSACSCKLPVSTKCIKDHVIEKRARLKLELGSAFFNWKFDEMGEEVSKSWTSGEQNSFEALVKRNPVSKNLSFWRPALERFPFKSRESIVSYYFNVYVPWRMSRQTRLTSTKVDTDDEEPNENVTFCKNSKARYLTGLR